MVSEIKQGLFKLDIIDYHAILGVPLDADDREIRMRYLKIVPKLHPDTCKANSVSDKEHANQILSRLVNPAYENLNKEKTKAEHILLLSQKGKAIAREGIKLTLATEKAKALAKAGKQLDTIYHKLIAALAMDQYRDLNTVKDKIGQISEINLVYLLFKETQNQQIRKQQRIVSTKPTLTPSEKQEQQALQKENINKDTSQGEKAKVSPLEASLKRAEEYRSLKKYKEAIFELRDALQIDPRSSTSHGLLGLVYLEQKNLSLAKVHIDKAWQIDPKDPIVIEAKEALKKQQTETSLSQKKSADSKPGMFSNLFGNKKK